MLTHMCTVQASYGCVRPKPSICLCLVCSWPMVPVTQPSCSPQRRLLGVTVLPPAAAAPQPPPQPQLAPPSSPHPHPVPPLPHLHLLIRLVMYRRQTFLYQPLPLRPLQRQQQLPHQLYQQLHHQLRHHHQPMQAQVSLPLQLLPQFPLTWFLPLQPPLYLLPPLCPPPTRSSLFPSPSAHQLPR